MTEWHFRLYDAHGCVEHTVDTLEEAIATSVRRVMAEPGLVDMIVLANAAYDEPNYNPQTGEPCEGVINKQEIFIGAVFYDRAANVLWWKGADDESTDRIIEVMSDGTVRLH